MEKKDFEAKLGKTFTARLFDGKTQDLELISVEPLNKAQGVDNAREEPFSLIFLGPDSNVLPDNSYPMSIDKQDEQSIFISAHKQDQRGVHYDAVFT